MISNRLKLYSFHKLFVFLSVVVLGSSLTACITVGPYVQINGKTVHVEVVRSLEKQALGLMYRTEMAKDHGMLFIYPRATPMSFWMKNTKISLDIIYFDQNLKLINISANTPPCRTDICPGYPSTAPAQYVLEINGGLAAQWQLQPGDLLELHLD